MGMTDFEYCGESLSSFGMTLCTFDYDGSGEENIANQIEMNNVKPIRSDVYFSVSSEYDNVFEKDFSICKDPCLSTEDVYLGEEEVREVVRWLNRKTYGVFKPIYDDGRFHDSYFMATFNLTAVKAAGEVVGFNLHMTTNAPYAFQDAINYEYENITSLQIDDSSDEVGHIYCDAEITCLSGGELKITNSADPNYYVSVKNCQAGETITFKGRIKQLTTSRDSHKTIWDDFNYRFIRVLNDYDNSMNEFTFSIPCDVKLSYSPVRKVGFV